MSESQGSADEAALRLEVARLRKAHLNIADALGLMNLEITRLRKALQACADKWSSPPGNFGETQTQLSIEFQRRMNLAADALQRPSYD